MVLKPPLSGSGYSGYPPGTVPGMRKCRITRHCFFDRGLDLIIQVLGICVSARALLCRRRVGRVNLSEAAWGMLGQRARAKWSPPRARMLNTGGSVNKIHGSSNQIRVLRTKIRVLFVFVFKIRCRERIFKTIQII